MQMPHPSAIHPASMHVSAGLPANHFLPSPALASPVGSTGGNPAPNPPLAANAPCSTLFVANLGQFVSEHELKEIFARWVPPPNPVVSLSIPFPDPILTFPFVFFFFRCVSHEIQLTPRGFGLNGFRRDSDGDNTYCRVEFLWFIGFQPRIGLLPSVPFAVLGSSD